MFYMLQMFSRKKIQSKFFVLKKFLKPSLILTEIMQKTSKNNMKSALMMKP